MERGVREGGGGGGGGGGGRFEGQQREAEGNESHGTMTLDRPHHNRIDHGMTNVETLEFTQSYRA